MNNLLHALGRLWVFCAAAGLVLGGVVSPFTPDSGSTEPTASFQAIAGSLVALLFVAVLVLAGLQVDLGRLLPLAFLILAVAVLRWAWLVAFVAERDSSVRWAAFVALMTAPLVAGPAVVSAVLLKGATSRDKLA